MKPLAAGVLNNKVTFQKATVSDDGYNQQTWSDDFTKWVKIETGLAKEAEQSGSLIGEITHSLKCHYSPSISADHRIKHKDNIYEIVGKPININFANVTTLILVKELTNA